MYTSKSREQISLLSKPQRQNGGINFAMNLNAKHRAIQNVIEKMILCYDVECVCDLNSAKRMKKKKHGWHKFGVV